MPQKKSSLTANQRAMIWALGESGAEGIARSEMGVGDINVIRSLINKNLCNVIRGVDGGKYLLTAEGQAEWQKMLAS